MKVYPVARGKIPPPCLIGVEEAGIGMARMAGEQATHWFLGSSVAQKRGLGIRVVEESRFGNSRGPF